MKTSLYVLALVVAGCGGTTVTATLTTIPSDAPTPTPTLTASPTPTPSPTPTLSPSPSPIPPPTGLLAEATPWPACVNGWSTPVPNDLPGIYERGLEILSTYMGEGPFLVDHMRYFVGPDPDNILDPRFEHVERWYIKATLSTDSTYRGRWLIERRTADRLGVSAVAPYDTVGYVSPDWHGFEGDGAPRAIEGLPGLWGGIDYDFVTGEGDSGFPGLPDSQSECLSGT